MLDELLKQAIAVYVRPSEQAAALITFRGLMNAQAAAAESKVIAELTGAIRKAEKDERGKGGGK